MKKRKFTGIRDIKGKMIFEGDIILGDSKVYWNKEKGMWGISNGKQPLGDYKYREDFIKVDKKSKEKKECKEIEIKTLFKLCDKVRGWIDEDGGFHKEKGEYSVYLEIEDLKREIERYLNSKNLKGRYKNGKKSS